MFVSLLTARGDTQKFRTVGLINNCGKGYRNAAPVGGIIERIAIA